ncbi:kinase-like domain-containing protein [Rhizophagus irregularis DAOM 181602=DAOM 197198]|nr:kinase-like domain-containing protein [Rhizophagus irregularis DAOM 181602=DAOM 197198]
METKYNKLNISNHKICSYCNKPFTENLWCKKCDPCRIMEGWTSGNSDIDSFIKDTMYNNARKRYYYVSRFLEWVPFDRFTDIKKIGEGGFAEVYSATWIDGKSTYEYSSYYGSWRKVNSNPEMKIALKRLNGSQTISDKYLNELKIHFYLSEEKEEGLGIYGLTKDPETKDFMMIIEFADRGNLRNILLNNFNNIMWKDKIYLLYHSLIDLRDLHKLGYLHKDFHSGNILQNKRDDYSIDSYISDFGLSGPANEQKSDVHDPQLVDLEISNIMQLEDTCDENNADDSID